MIIAPSLLAADLARLGKEVARAEQAGADWLHFDIMDGHFVPNISFGPGIVRAIRPLTKLPLDVHLMCSRPEILLEPFARAGADRILVQIELDERAPGLLWKIRSFDKEVGLVINPPTAMERVEPFLGQIDSLLVMTVNPGFGGQEFITETLPKIQQAYAWRQEKKLNFHIAVDGGVNLSTVGECAQAGADFFISGTGLFGEKSLKRAINKMRALALKFAPATEQENVQV